MVMLTYEDFFVFKVKTFLRKWPNDNFDSFIQTEMAA